MTVDLPRPFIQLPFDYTSRDFDSLRADLTRRMQLAIPEWTGFDGSFEKILIEMFAYTGDISNFYIDRQGAEAFLATAVLRESVLNIANSIGYIPSAQAASTVSLTFTKLTSLLANAVTVPIGTVVIAAFDDEEPVYFETMAALTIAAAAESGSVNAHEGRSVEEEVVGVSNGAANMWFRLFFPGVIKDSVHVFTADGPVDPATQQQTLIEWTRVDRLIDAAATDRVFTTYLDENNNLWVGFGDGISGEIPQTTVDIRVSYRYGVGAEGNVGAGTIRQIQDDAVQAQVSAVSNTTAAQGGADAETIESMRTSIPNSLKALNRAVTTDDYAAMAIQVPGVAKASASSTVPALTQLYVAPVGGGLPTATLKNDVLLYFTVPRRMPMGVTLVVNDPTYKPVNVTLAVEVNSKYRRDLVVLGVTAVVEERFAFETAVFGKKQSRSFVFHDVVEVPGVDYVDVTVFSLTGAGTADITLAINELAQLGTLTINATGGIVLP